MDIGRSVFLNAMPRIPEEYFLKADQKGKNWLLLFQNEEQ